MSNALAPVGGVGPAAGAADRARPLAGLSRSRQIAGWALLILGLPALTAVLVPLRPTLSLPSDLLLYLLAVVLVAVVGGVVPAAVAAVAASLLLNYWFTRPYLTFSIAQRDHLLALIVFLIVALTVSVTVDLAGRQRVSAANSSAEAATMSRLVTGPLAEQPLPAVLEQVRGTFGMTSVALLRVTDGSWSPVAAVGADQDWSTGRGEIVSELDPTLRLVGCGPAVFAEDRRVLAAYAATAARALHTQQLAEEAARARELALVDQLLAALLAAVGHDLRTPLAGIKAAVSSLRQHDVAWSPQETEDLLATVEESADRLTALVANLLDMSRLQAGALSVELRPVALDEVVPAALLPAPAGRVEVRVADTLPLVLADPGLLERAVANLVANALRYAPPHRPVTVAAASAGSAVRLDVIDHGPGVSAAAREQMFAPFQRLGDRTPGGVGLGLAIARGFTEAMGGTLVPTDTAGGGLTMTLTLPVAR
ncbi:MAG: DUF4118 domain-containing protein [Frankiaceae bacterium]